ncbi:hypothetical protein INS49_009711 [Diaporthe citri]|uniref:uncharacterized protein n=1 Tax=Diaporthe citri TaxID=83186 RepID=UPI001C7F3793|nr:uncharacterized protein INS49_009711 [Diaporthe citri]KAG6361484.1 hypothetical protein INS49_009711 [Diaporthe citri]
MAPDLNSVPPSPRVLALSRRASTQQMPPPPAPSSGQGHAPSTSDPALNILPSNQNAVNTGAPTTASLPSPRLVATGSTAHPPADASSLASGPGPTRHPHPLTAAELHQQVEKEQEAVVNRLTRELEILRQHNDASSASASDSGTEPSTSTIPMIPDGRQHLLSGSGFSIPSQTSGRERRHTRSGSSASARSIAATTGSTSVVNITSPAPIRPGATALSRQNSTQSHSRQSLSSSPAHASSFASSHMADAAHGGYFHLRSATGASSQAPSHTQATPGSGSTEMMSPSMMSVTSRYEETAFHRQELETVKRENDALKRRIRELERQVRERRASDANTRPRSESVSTTASVNVSGGGAGIAPPRGDRVTSVLSTAGSTAGSVAVGVPEDELRVGESAASAGQQNPASGDQAA